MRMKYRVAGVALVAVLSVTVGCGGAGSSATSSSTNSLGTTGRAEALPDGNTKAEGQVGKLGLFMTATGATTYDHIWATVLKVELIDVMEKPVTVYDDLNGFTIDLKNLSDSRKLALLSCVTAPSGKSYLRVRITFDKALQLFELGSNVAKVTPFSDSVARDEQERPLISFPLNRPRDLANGKENLVVEFGLDKLAVTEGRAIPALREGSADGPADPSRQEAGLFVGTVSDVSTNDQGATFSLTLGANRSVMIQASNGTAYYNDGPVPSPSLVSGKRVAVRGILANDTRRVMATEVTVYGEGKEAITPLSVLRGTIASVDPQSGTIALKATHVDGMTPSLDAVTVLVAPDAVLRSSGGLLMKNDEFYATLSKPGSLARFEGVYEPVSGTLKATRGKVEEAKFNPAHEASVYGVPTEVDEKKKSLIVDSAVEWQGIALKEGKGVPVITTAATAYQDDKGGSLAHTTFYDAAAKGENSVRVIGIYNEGKITATRLELLPPLPKPEPKAEAKAETKEGEKKATTEAKTESNTEESKKAPSSEKPEEPKPEPAKEPMPEPAKPETPAP